MKALIASLLLATSTLFGAEGVFYVDKPVESHLVAQTGATTTNLLAAGSTTAIGATTITELCPKEKTTIYLSGGPIISADGGSVVSINTLDVEVTNLTNQPSLAAFGFHNVSLGLSKGIFSITYPVQDANSVCAISTPLAMYQLNAGKFVFDVGDNRSLVYVLDGMLIIHGDKNRTDSAKKGSKSITGQIDAEIATTTRPINSKESNSIVVENKPSTSVQWIVVEGRVWGVKMTP